MKYIPIVFTILLTACSGGGVDTEIVTSTKHLVVLPPDRMYTCPSVDRFPDAKTLSDLQVAKLLVQLQSNNVQCRNSITAIKKFLADAKATAEKDQPE
jgi:hypothetical protein